MAFNILDNTRNVEDSLIASGVVSVFKKLYGDSWGLRLEYVLRNTVLTLLPVPQTSLLSLLHLLTDDDYRNRVLHHITDPFLLSFWAQEYNALPPGKRLEIIAPIQNKVGQFLASPMMRNILGQGESKLDFRTVMDQKKIAIANLSKGKLGEDNSEMLGALLVTKIQLDAMSRSDSENRPDFYLYVDEFQNMATSSFSNILSEARKYHLNLVIAHQYLDQLSPEIGSAVFGNVGSTIAFQVGANDAEVLSQHFAHPRLTPQDFINLSKYNILCRIMTEGQTSPPFSATTLPPQAVAPDPTKAEIIKTVSRQHYGTAREIVEQHIYRNLT